MRLREVRLGPFDLELEHRPDGTIRARSPHSLGNYPSRLTERLEHWAEHAPARTFLAKRGPDGAWRRLTYAETLEGVRRIGQALLERGLSPERPLAILSGNDLEHALLALAAQHVRDSLRSIAYSLVSQDFGKLHEIIDLIRPAWCSQPPGAHMKLRSRPPCRPRPRSWWRSIPGGRLRHRADARDRAHERG